MMLTQLTAKTLARRSTMVSHLATSKLATSSFARSLNTAATPKLGFQLTPKQRTYAGIVGGLLLAGLHSATGSQDDFFDYRFAANKSADDLATFYGGEEFMELFCIFPFVGNLMMRNGHFDEQGNVMTQGFPGTLKVSMVFSDEANEETGETEWFNKRERFRNTFMGWTAWDMVINFGFRTRDDGTIEVYHHGEYFHGNMPVVSQMMKLVFTVHARWLAWSTEHHVNHYAFSDTEEGEELEEESRKNMPLFLLKHYAWTDLMAMLLGRESKTPSFLVKKHSTDDDNLPIQNDITKLRIRQDIVVDRMMTKDILQRHDTQTPDDVRSALANVSSNLGRKATAYGAATEAARLRRLTRANTLKRGDDMNQGTKEQEDFSNDQSAYEAATAAARLRQISRANTVLQMNDDAPIDKKATARHLTRINTFRRNFQDPDEAENHDLPQK